MKYFYEIENSQISLYIFVPNIQK